ncbi:CoA ester lyase [Microvirga sp. KLBC 81]|uniref:HpcH/HpaI aldolase/citrate lyase family protein n=1 Tax=Microvirga sp. KLBC 81 TaxID=1862707 RepID=UPI001403C572|nr:aldolase/citrate lyase family protein [Microvirga sp. KLBC 81]
MTTAIRKRGLRRSKLVAKGGTWKAIAAANASAADIVHIELESGFPPEARAAAVETTRMALTEMDWSGKEAWVRFPHIDAPETKTHLAYVLGGRPHLVYCAKVKSVDDILRLDEAVSRGEDENGIEPGSTQIGAVIERIEALSNVEAIAAASPRMGAIMFGANDMSLDFGYRRTGIVGVDHETLYIRSRMVLAGRLAKIDIIDAAFMNRNDIESSDADAQFSARMGFTGKNALSADQIPGIHRAFVPTPKELTWAREVLAAAAHEDVSLRLIDGDPIEAFDILRAETLIARAG